LSGSLPAATHARDVRITQLLSQTSFSSVSTLSHTPTAGRFGRTSGSLIHLEPSSRFEELGDLSLKCGTFRWIFGAEFQSTGTASMSFSRTLCSATYTVTLSASRDFVRELPIRHPQATPASRSIVPTIYSLESRLGFYEQWQQRRLCHGAASDCPAFQVGRV
jgi:hypothetical protein